MGEILRNVALIIELFAILEVNVGILISAFATSLPMRIRIMVVPVHASIGFVIWYVTASIASKLS